MNKTSIVTVLFLLIFCPFALSEGVYSWIDGAGVKHFNNSPPPPEAIDVITTSEIPYDLEIGREQSARNDQFFNSIEQENAVREKETSEKDQQTKQKSKTIIIQEEDDIVYGGRVRPRERIRDDHENKRKENNHPIRRTRK